MGVVKLCPVANATATYTTLIAVACAYYLTATIGLTFAVPPGYATLLWPPAGIALGAAYVWGWKAALAAGFGSYMANLWVPSATDRAMVVLAGALPAVGAVVQSWVGAVLLHRYCDLRRWSASNVVRYALVTIASCTINGVWGPASLSFAGFMDQSTMAHNIQTWWLGDCLGALVFAPLLIFLVGETPVHGREQRQEARPES